MSIHSLKSSSPVNKDQRNTHHLQQAQKQASQKPGQKQHHNERKQAKFKAALSNCCAGLRKVFWTRKSYIPGDTYRCFWQKTLEIKKWYIAYRVVHVVLCFACIVVSFLRIESYTYEKYLVVCYEGRKRLMAFCPEDFVAGIHVNLTWPFYLTRWGMLGNLIQGLMGLVLTVRRHARESRPTDNASMRGSLSDKKSTAKAISPKIPEAKSGLSKSSAASAGVTSIGAREHSMLTSTGFYWALHSGFVALATLITTMYWSIIWSDRRPLALIVQTIEHAFNSVIMITDFVLVAFPVVMSHIVVVMSIFVAYTAFTFFHFLAGGLNQEFETQILYKGVDWEKSPSKTLAFAFGQFLAVSTFFCVYLLIDYIKFKCKPRIITDNRHSSHV